jgi:hypothetical protein
MRSDAAGAAAGAGGRGAGLLSQGKEKAWAANGLTRAPTKSSERCKLRMLTNWLRGEVKMLPSLPTWHGWRYRQGAIRTDVVIEIPGTLSLSLSFSLS